MPVPEPTPGPDAAPRGPDLQPNRGSGLPPIPAPIPRAAPPAHPETSATVMDSARSASRTARHSGLVAVRYLPARVAIGRMLRSLGWFVLEATELEDLPGMLARVRYTAVFTEAPDAASPGWLAALERARAEGALVIAVGSRLRGRANDPLATMGDLPRLLHPFQEAEFERVLVDLRRIDGST